MSGTGRPWWVPLLGVGSIGLGGFQAVGGIGLAVLAAEIGGPAGTVFLGLAAGWLVPALLLAASGVGVVTGARWARGLSLAAAGAMLLAVGFAAAGRRAIPPAVAELVEHGRKGGPAADLLRKFQSSGGEDPASILRDPALNGGAAWVFAVEFACGTPWYLVVLAVCGLPSGRRIATR